MRELLLCKRFDGLLRMRSRPGDRPSAPKRLQAATVRSETADMSERRMRQSERLQAESQPARRSQTLPNDRSASRSSGLDTAPSLPSSPPSSHFRADKGREPPDVHS